jgi:uncharacterized protein (DUF1800 family)
MAGMSLWSVCKVRVGPLPWWAWLLLCALQACGGGGGGTSGTGSATDRAPLTALPVTDSSGITANAAAHATSTLEAHRFLRQASFGPSPASVRELMPMSYGEWIDAQWALPTQGTHLQTMDAVAEDLGAWARNPDALTDSWWSHALYDPAQLRHRVAFALSQIFVVSNKAVPTDTTADYLDLLTRLAGARYRDLLEAVTLHPGMGTYLSMLGNRKEDPSTGRVPDENFAREVMQLFSIGLYELDDSGQLKLNAEGAPIETYAASDVQGLARAFTGWSWARTAAGALAVWWQCFWRGPECSDATQAWTAMQPYGEEHATSAKRFLGVGVAVQASANPRASLQAALDRLASHPNTAPFISRQLIQKLVTSNPSATYVRDVVRVWRATDGNLQQVVKAILLHDEARHPERTSVDPRDHGKVTEPVLRVAHLFRALDVGSDAYTRRVQAGAMPFVLAATTDNFGGDLGATPMRANSVFNFYRPSYKPPLSEAASLGLVVPEMQMANETTTLTYANFVRQVMTWGWGQWGPNTTRCDLQIDFTRWQPLARDPQQLVGALAPVLLGQAVTSSQLTTMVTALQSMPTGTTEQQLDRVRATVLMLSVLPEFVVQR